MPPLPTRPIRALARLLALALIALVREASAWAESAPPASTAGLFGQDLVHTLRLTLSQAAWDALEPDDGIQGPDRGPDPGPDPGPGGAGSTPPKRPVPGARDMGPPGPRADERRFPWSTATFDWNGRVLTNVSLRYKGNSSFKMTRQGWKRPFKLDFNRAHPGREFEGETALFLNPNANDVSQIREALAYDACRAAGLPSPRTAFARVFLTIPGTQTDRYLGLYTVVEAVDNRFLREHFGTADGLLLKPERLPTLQYLGEDWSAYTNRYDPKTKARSSETARFIATTRLIQQADTETLKRELPTRIDLVSLLRYVALQALLANYDSFVGNGHNYYLFQPAREGADGRAVWIPWDLNEAFGGHPPGGARSQQAGFAILHPQANPNRLIDRVLADPAGAAAYRAEVERLLAGPCAPERLVALAARFATLVEPAIREESPAAHAQFQRVALARTNLPPAAPRRGPGFFPDPGRLDDLPLPAWIRLRLQNVREELDGARTAPAPRLTGFGAPRRPPEAPEPGRGRVPPRGPGPSESTDAPSP